MAAASPTFPGASLRVQTTLETAGCASGASCRSIRLATRMIWICIRMWGTIRLIGRTRRGTKQQRSSWNSCGVRKRLRTQLLVLGGRMPTVRSKRPNKRKWRMQSFQPNRLARHWLPSFPRLSGAKRALPLVRLAGRLCPTSTGSKKRRRLKSPQGQEPQTIPPNQVRPVVHTPAQPTMTNSVDKLAKRTTPITVAPTIIRPLITIGGTHETVSGLRMQAAVTFGQVGLGLDGSAT